MPKPNRDEKLTRELSIDKATRAIDEEARTVEVAFISEEPVTRWFGVEILDVRSQSVDLGRLNDGAPVLLDHDPTKQVGVVESARIDKDKVGRAVLRFGRGQLAQEVFQDIADDIRRKISTGYEITGEELIERGKDGKPDTYRFSTAPFEISLVSIPADNTVGIGRANPNITTHEVKPMPEVKTEKAETVADAPAPKTETRSAPSIQVTSEDQEQFRKEARKNEVFRIREITAIGKQFDAEKEAQQFIEEGHDVDSFRQKVLQVMAERKGRKNGDVIPEIGMDDKDVKQFSFARAISAVLFPNDRHVQNRAGFEIEVSQAAAQRAGFSASGLMVPPDVLKRDLNVTTATAGGNLVATDLLSGSFIELLRNRLITAQMGATILNNLEGNLAIPKQTGAATAYWLTPEGTAPTESQQTIGQVSMSPKTIGAFTEYTRQLLLQSSIDIEAFVRSDLVRVLALGLDLGNFYGSAASGQPRGIANQAGVNTTTFGATNPTFAEIVAMESAVAADNADIGTLGYAFNSAMRGHFKSTEKFSSTGQTIWEPGNTINGTKTGVSNQMTAGDVIYGNFADLVLGFWGGLDLMSDPYSLSTSGGHRVVALQSTDVAVRNVESFCVSNDGI